MVGRALKATIIGVMVGGVGAWTAARLLENSLFGVRPGDPTTLATAVLLLMLVALPASWVPARRAGAIEPVETLKQE